MCFFQENVCIFMEGILVKRESFFLRDGMRGEGGIWGRDWIVKIEICN